MRRIVVIGDVHGKINELESLLSRIDIPYYDKIIQLGDLGAGFFGDHTGNLGATDIILQDLPENFKFIRGNHDSPVVSQNSKFFWGDVVVDGGILAVSGALSVDRSFRKEGVSWWSDEELSDGMFESALHAARTLGPKLEIVITHDCPSSVLKTMFNMSDKAATYSRTGDWLEKLRRICSPKYWVFGHHHQSAQLQVGRTTFICLKELEAKEFTLD